MWVNTLVALYRLAANCILFVSLRGSLAGISMGGGSAPLSKPAASGGGDTLDLLGDIFGAAPWMAAAPQRLQWQRQNHQLCLAIFWIRQPQRHLIPCGSSFSLNALPKSTFACWISSYAIQHLSIHSFNVCRSDQVATKD
jgi:hypothetical protein